MTMTPSLAPDPAARTEVLSLIDEDMTEEAGREFVAAIAIYLARAASGGYPVSTALPHGEIAGRLDIAMPEAGRPLADVMQHIVDDLIPESNWLHHPMAMGHQVAPPLPASVWTESLIGALNQSLAVWEMSPVASILETRVVRWMCDLAELGPNAGGTFTSGGTEATLTALLAARNARFPDTWERGIIGSPVILCGADAHYAVARAAGILGIGTSNLITVPTREHRMDVEVLTRALDELAARDVPVIAVVATAGSTPTGSFDDLVAIADVCDARDLWMHVDGAHGASALLSSSHRARLRGIERARSIAWDPHKMMLMPLSAGMLLVRDASDLDAAFAQRAPYLFDDGEEQRARDHGRRSFMCSRRADVLKVWIALHRYGRAGLAAIHDHLCATTHGLWAAVRERSDFEAPHEPESNILCFRYVGTGTSDDGSLDALNADIRERYNRSGHGWITTTVLDGHRVLRVTVMNPRTGAGHVLSMLERVAELGLSAAGVDSG
jgi:L-2,4-diaminobutyrate decarboxylase